MSRDYPSLAKRDNAKRGGSVARAERRYYAVLLTCCEEGCRTWVRANECGRKRAQATGLTVKTIINERVDRYAK